MALTDQVARAETTWADSDALPICDQRTSRTIRH